MKKKSVIFMTIVLLSAVAAAGCGKQETENEEAYVISDNGIVENMDVSENDVFVMPHPMADGEGAELPKGEKDKGTLASGENASEDARSPEKTPGEEQVLVVNGTDGESAVSEDEILLGDDDWEDEDWEEDEDEEEEDDSPRTSGDVDLTDIYGEKIMVFHIPSGLIYYPEYSEEDSYYNLMDQSEEMDFYIENELSDEYREVYESGEYAADDNGMYDVNVFELNAGYNGVKAKALEFGYRDEEDGSFEYDFNFIILPYKNSEGESNYITIEFNSGAEEYTKSDYEKLFRQLFN